MNSLDEFFAALPERMNAAGYETHPVVAFSLPGGLNALYAHCPLRYQVAAAKMEDHFLFIPWDPRMGQPEARLRAAHRWLRGPANAGFRTPHAWRLSMPGLAVAAVSAEGYDEETRRFSARTKLNPWYGGEVGQVVLADLARGTISGYQPVSYRDYGYLPLAKAVERLSKALQLSLAPVER